jgi:hypothetical protein
MKVAEVEAEVMKGKVATKETMEETKDTENGIRKDVRDDPNVRKMKSFINHFSAKQRKD